MSAIVNVRMKQRRKTAAAWVSANEVLLDGEIGLETDTRKQKFGDGATAWNSLLYAAPDLTGALLTSQLDTDVTLAANSDAKVASQKAVKTYADSLIAAQDAMVFKGVIDCSANPNYPAADRGWTYRVSVAGKIGGGSGINVEAGDLLLCLTDGTASGNQATVGANWSVIQTNLDGSVIGPASAVDATPSVFDGTSGKLIKNITFAAFKALLSLVKGDVGLANVDNTADTAKPVSTAQQTALNLKANIASPTFTGLVTVSGSFAVEYNNNAFGRGITFKNANTGTTAINGAQWLRSDNVAVANVEYYPSNYANPGVADKFGISTLGSSAGLIFITNVAGSAGAASGDMQWKIAGNTDPSIFVKGGDGSGNVGIGTDDPQVKLDVNDDSIRIRTSASPASGAAGVAGQIKWDAGYLYVCVATNTWRRVATTGSY